MRTLILALGNPLRGDDGVGEAVLEHLRSAALPHDVALMDGGTAGLEIVLLLQNCERAVIIDAADMDRNPGEWAWFTPSQVCQNARDMHLRGTLHYAGLAEALTLGAALNLLPPHIDIVGIQPETIDWRTGLSEPVLNAVPRVAEEVRRLINGAM
ncbi:MAG: hydrogenase maturation protease [Aggregatilineales bacterium]